MCTATYHEIPTGPSFPLSIKQALYNGLHFGVSGSLGSIQTLKHCHCSNEKCTQRAMMDTVEKPQTPLMENKRLHHRGGSWHHWNPNLSPVIMIARWVKGSERGRSLGGVRGPLFVSYKTVNFTFWRLHRGTDVRSPLSTCTFFSPGGELKLLSTPIGSMFSKFVNWLVTESMAPTLSCQLSCRLIGLTLWVVGRYFSVSQCVFLFLFYF